MRINGRAIVSLLLGSLLVVGLACGNDNANDEAGTSDVTGTPAPPDPNVVAEQAAAAI